MVVYSNQPGHEKYVSAIGQHLVSAPPLALYPGFLSEMCPMSQDKIRAETQALGLPVILAALNGE